MLRIKNLNLIIAIIFFIYALLNINPFIFSILKAQKYNVINDETQNIPKSKIINSSENNIEKYDGFILEVKSKNTRQNNNLSKNKLSLFDKKLTQNNFILIKDINKIKEIEKDFFIKNIQKNYIRNVTTLPNDILYNGNNVSINSKSNQWNLEQLGFTNTSNTDSIWNTVTSSKDTIIAVIDTGISLTNPDIINFDGTNYGNNNLWVNQNEIPNSLKSLIDTNNDQYISSLELINYYINNSLDINNDGTVDYLDILTPSNNPNHVLNNVDDDLNGVQDDIFGYNFGDNNPNINDLHGHGTHVAGIIGAVTNNNQGIASICWNCSLMNIKVSSGSTGFITDNNLISGIIYAVDNGAKIINLSLGGPGYNQELENAIKYAWNNGVLVIASAGNNYGDDTSKIYPASHPFVLAVGSLNHNDVISFFSNKGNRIDLVSYGDKILSTVINHPNYNNNCLISSLIHYTCLSGTSMSSPHISAVAGLLYDKHKNDSTPWTARDIRNALLKTAIDLGTLGFDETYGFGKLNPKDALEFNGFTEIDNTPPIASINGLSNTFQKGTFSISGTASDENLYIYTIAFKPAPNFILREFAGRGNKVNSNLQTINFNSNNTSDNIPDGQYQIVLRAEDFYGNFTEAVANNVFIDNTPPSEFTIIQPAQNAFITQNTINFLWTQSVDNISNVVYDLYINDNMIESNLNTNSYNYNTNLLNEGNNTWKVIAKDQANNIRNSDMRNIIIDRTPPNTFNIEIEKQANNVMIYFTTTDNIGINNYQLSLNDGPYNIVTSPHQINNLLDGNYIVKIRACDFSGLCTESNSSFNITYLCDNRKSKADFNCDGMVNISDLSILAANWNKTNNNADANGDNKINLSDLSILAANWNKNF